MNMNVGERLITISILPQEGTFIEMKVVQGIINKLSLSSDDIISYDITESNGQVTWNDKGKIPKEFGLNEVETAIIVKSLRSMDENAQITRDIIPVYEKFLKV